MKWHQGALLGALIATGLGVVSWQALQDAPEGDAVSMAQATDTSATPDIDRPAEPATASSGTTRPRKTTATAPAQALAPGPPTRVPISFEHQQMISMGTDGGDDLHTMFEKEPKDNPAWAYETEAYLRSLLDEVGAEVYSLECRSETCEVQAFADAGASAGSIMEMSSKVDMHRLMPSVGLSIPVNERQPVLMYFTRVVPKGTTEAEKEGARRRRQIVESLKSR